MSMVLDRQIGDDPGDGAPDTGRADLGPYARPGLGRSLASLFRG